MTGITEPEAAIELRAEELVVLATAYEQGFDHPQPDGEAALFTITEVGLEEGDEYAFYALDTLVIAGLEEGDWRGRLGVVTDHQP